MSPYSYDLSGPQVAKATGFTAKRQGRLLRRARDMNARRSSVLPTYDVSYSTSGYARARCGRQRNSRATVEILPIFDGKAVINPLSIIERITRHDTNRRRKRDGKRSAYDLSLLEKLLLISIHQASRKIWDINFHTIFITRGLKFKYHLRCVIY